MKNIIVPFDFSKEAANSIPLATQLANDFKANLIFVYVQCANEISHADPDDELARVEREFVQLKEEVRGQLQHEQRVECVVRTGKVYREVVSLAKAHEDSVIVTSTHGASGFDEFFVGSNTLRIVATTDTPVFTVRNGVAVQPIRSIIFPLDTSLESRQKSGYVARLSHAYGATVHILGVIENVSENQRTKIEQYMRQVEEFFVQQKVAHQSTFIEGEDVVEAMVQYANARPDSLIAITEPDTRTHPIFLIGKKSQRLLCQSPVPVLVLAPQINVIRSSFQTFGVF